MAILLIGYDVEMGGEITRRFLEKVKMVHLELNAPCTLFIKGEILDEHRKALVELLNYGLFDLQQHTYSHLPLKTVAQEINGRLSFFRKGGSLEEIYQEVKKTSDLMREILGVECLGICGPYGYYRGLIDRPDILKVLHNLGIRFTRTYGRNAKDWQPVPFEIQPFWYEAQGFPDILEFPVQGWCDSLWRGCYGSRGYLRHLKREIDRLVEMDLSWSYLQHDWTSIRGDPEMETTEKFIDYARRMGVELKTHLNYYEEVRRKRPSRVVQSTERPIIIRIKAGSRYKKFTNQSLRVLIPGPGDNENGDHVVRGAINALKGLGHEVSIKEVKGRVWAARDDFLNGLIEVIRETHPDFILSFDHLGPVGELLAKMEIPSVCWFMANPFYYIHKSSINKYSVLFLADRFYIKGLKGMGFEHVYHLPRAANQEVFRKMELKREEIASYESDLSFCGSSNYPLYKRFKEFLRGVWDLNLRDIIDQTVELQARNPGMSISDILEVVQDSLQAWLPFETEQEKRDFERQLESFVWAIEQKRVIERIAHLGLHLYGDDGWKRLLDGRVRFSGRIDPQRLPKLYNASRINLNITPIQNKSSLDQRVFDVSSCGGFVLTDYRRDLESMFDIGKEIVFYRDTDDLEIKVEYFLKHPDEREEIAASAQKRVQREHTYEVRMRHLIGITREVFAGRE